jgi:hypothetical protein
MTHFTPEDVLSNIAEKFQPKALTLETIRQFAYAYVGQSSTSQLVLN